MSDQNETRGTMSTNTERGECRVCGRMLTVNGTGLLRHHVNKAAPMDGPWRPRCAGSGDFPLYVVKDGSR